MWEGGGRSRHIVLVAMSIHVRTLTSIRGEVGFVAIVTERSGMSDKRDWLGDSQVIWVS